MRIIIQGIKCFLLAVFWGVSPIALGFILGRVTMNKYDYLISLFERLREEGKITDAERERFIKAVNELREESEVKNG